MDFRQRILKAYDRENATHLGLLIAAMALFKML
jgi:hypothetical protein